ncbi:tetratricopeptide repeat protein [Cyanobacteria bacterium FACHB-DQ100]|nr:tetratricopeptide repeat protein [Cyanobacteria bacterium FACHB-DQ100]
MTAQALFDRATERYRNKDYRRAFADLNQAIVLKPDFAEAYSSRGNTRLKLDYVNEKMNSLEQVEAIQSTFREAMADYEKAIKLKPDLAEAYSGRGAIYLYWFGDAKKAIIDFDLATKLKPDLADPFFFRGSMYKYYCDRQRATANLQQAAALYKQQGNLEQYHAALALVQKFGQPKAEDENRRKIGC